MAAGRGYCTMRMAVWRSSFSYAKLNLRLLQQSQPLFTSMDARRVIGGEPETSREGRRGLRGGATAPSPASTPKQRRTTSPPGRPVPAPPSLTLRTPYLHKHLSLLHLSQHRLHRCYWQRRPRQRRRRLHHRWYRNHRLFHHSQLPHRENGQRPSAKRLAPVAVLR